MNYLNNEMIECREYTQESLKTIVRKVLSMCKLH